MCICDRYRRSVPCPDLRQTIVLVGPSCSGKSTLAQRLSALLGIPRVEMDDMIWLPGWRRLDHKPEGKDEFRRQRNLATSGASWVCAGAWTSGRDIVYSRASIVVSLDLGLWTVFERMVWRTFWRCWTGTPVCNGNQETFASTIFGQHLIFRYFWKQWPRQRDLGERQRHLEELKAQAPKADVLYLTSIEQVDAWIVRSADGR